MKDKLKIIFVGMPDMALVCLSILLEKKYNIVAVIPPRKTHETYSSFINYALINNLNIIDFNKTPNETECIEKIKELNADIGVVCSYDMKFNKEFLSSTRLGYINCHPSLLPDYRGAMPYFHIIKNNEKISGITLHFMDENFDTGDIIYQEKFIVLPWENMGTLFNRTNFMFADALVKVLDDFQNNKEFKKTPQKKSDLYKKAPKVDGNLRIRWNRSAEEISCLIRACNPFFNAFTSFRNISMKIIKAHVVEYNQNMKPGKIVKCDENNLLIATSKDLLAIEMLQLSSWGFFNPYEFFHTFTPNENEELQ